MKVLSYVRVACVVAASFLVGGCAATGQPAGAHPGSVAQAAEKHAAPGVAPAEGLARLEQGNARFVAERLMHPHQSAERRTEVAGGQHPFAVVLACADSRTAPELVFDQGLGDLFVVRVAGNVLNDENVASIEYAVEHLGARLVVVLGHERCGAIAAARETIDSRGTAPGHLQSLVEAIRPAVESTRGQDAQATSEANVRNVVRALRESEPVLHELVGDGALQVIGSMYDLDSGAVSFLDARPDSADHAADHAANHAAGGG